MKTDKENGQEWKEIVSNITYGQIERKLVSQSVGGLKKKTMGAKRASDQVSLITLHASYNQVNKWNNCQMKKKSLFQCIFSLTCCWQKLLEKVGNIGSHLFSFSSPSLMSWVCISRDLWVESQEKSFPSFFLLFFLSRSPSLNCCFHNLRVYFSSSLIHPSILQTPPGNE